MPKNITVCQKSGFISYLKAQFKSTCFTLVGIVEMTSVKTERKWVIFF